MHRNGFITAGSMNYHIKDITIGSVDYVATLKVLVINGKVELTTPSNFARLMTIQVSMR